MPQIHFIVATQAINKRPFLNALTRLLSEDQGRSVYIDRTCGALSDFVNVSDINDDTVKTLVASSISANESADDIVFMSYGISNSISALLETYPEAAVYVLRRRTEDNLSNEKVRSEYISNAKVIADIEESAIAEAHTNTINSIQQLIDDNSLTFDILKKKFFNENGEKLIVNESTEDWRYSNLKVATINLPTYS